MSNEKTGFMSLKELSQAYKISNWTMKRRLEEIFIHIPNKRKSLYSPKELELIINRLGPF